MKYINTGFLTAIFLNGQKICCCDSQDIILLIGLGYQMHNYMGDLVFLNIDSYILLCLSACEVYNEIGVIGFWKGIILTLIIFSLILIIMWTKMLF